MSNAEPHNEEVTPRDLARRALLSLLPKGSIGAEVGVAAGDFSAQIIEVVQPRHLVLIDPWDLLAEKLAGTPDAGRWYADSGKMAAFHASVVERFAGNAAVEVGRGFSQTLLVDYPDDHFDWVYLDANHRYEDVRRELLISAKKVKVGGYIAGDDLFRKHEGRAEVSDALMDWLRACGGPDELARIRPRKLPARVDAPSHVRQQFIVPVTRAMKAG